MTNYGDYSQRQTSGIGNNSPTPTPKTQKKGGLHAIKVILKDWASTMSTGITNIKTQGLWKALASDLNKVKDDVKAFFSKSNPLKNRTSLGRSSNSTKKTVEISSPFRATVPSHLESRKSTLNTMNKSRTSTLTPMNESPTSTSIKPQAALKNLLSPKKKSPSNKKLAALIGPNIKDKEGQTAHSPQGLFKNSALMEKLHEFMDVPVLSTGQYYTYKNDMPNLHFLTQIHSFMKMDENSNWKNQFEEMSFSVMENSLSNSKLQNVTNDFIKLIDKKDLTLNQAKEFLLKCVDNTALFDSDHSFGEGMNQFKNWLNK